MSFISRIISLRDADRSRKQRAIRQKHYALACEPMYDDSDSCDADDECYSDDEFYVVTSSSDSNGERDDDSRLADDESSDINITEDYFNSSMLTSEDENNMAREDDPTVIKLALSGPFGVIMQGPPINRPGDIHVADEDRTSLVLEESIALRDGIVDQHNDDGTESDDWTFACATYSDMWGYGCETTEMEENYVAVDVYYNPYHNTHGG